MSCVDGVDAETSVCPVGWVLSDCGSLCQCTCEDYLTSTHRDCPEDVCGMPSCVCPEGLVVFKDRCVDPLECHSLIQCRLMETINLCMHHFMFPLCCKESVFFQFNVIRWSGGL